MPTTQSLDSVTQSFLDLKRKLEAFAALPPKLESSFADTIKSLKELSFSDAIKGLKDLTDGLGGLKDEAGKASDGLNKLASSAGTVKKEYESQASIMAAYTAAQVQATQQLQALQQAATPQANAGGGLINHLLNLVGLGGTPPAPNTGSPSPTPTPSPTPPPTPPASTGRWKSMVDKVGKVRDAFNSSERVISAKASYKEVTEGGLTDKFTAPLGVFNSLKGPMASIAADMEKVGEKVPASLQAATASAARFDAALSATQNALIVGLAPAMEVAANIMTWLISLVEPLTQFLNTHAEAVRGVAMVVVPLVSFMFGLAKVIQFVTFVTELWGAAQKVLNIIMADNPWGLALMGLISFVSFLAYGYTHFEKFRGILAGTWAGLKLFGQYCLEVVKIVGLMSLRLSPAALISGDVRDFASKGIAASMAKLKSLPSLSVTFTQSQAAAEAELRASNKKEEDADKQKKSDIEKQMQDLQKKRILESPRDTPDATPGIGLSSIKSHASIQSRAGGNQVVFNIHQLGTTTFHVDSVDKKHAVAMQEAVRVALLGALQDVAASSPALA